jgi:hypothetical protein
MSRSVDLFIASSKPIDELATQMAEAAGVTLAPGDVPGTWALDDQDVHAELHDHPYVDDGDLVLERYRYALSARVDADRRLADAAETVLLRLVSESLRKAGLATLLVLDLQYRDRHSPHGEPVGAETRGGSTADGGAGAAAGSVPAGEEP